LVRVRSERTGVRGVHQEVMGVQQRGFLDRVLQFMGIQDESDEPQEEVRARPETAPQTSAHRPPSQSATAADRRRSGRLVSLPGPNRAPSQFKVAVIQPRAYEEVEQIADHLKERQPVIISLDGLDKAVSRRIIDFVSGTTYALDGTIHRIGEGIFLLAPINVAIDAEMARTWHEEELFS